MKRQPFEKGESYPVSQIIDVVLADIESGRFSHIPEKLELLEKFKPFSHLTAVFSPFGGPWGNSSHNPNAWKREDGSDLIPGYRQPRQRRSFSQSMRKAVMEKTAGRCYSCGHKFSDASEVWIEHIVPFSAGGSNEIENLLPGCPLCNFTRQNFTPRKIQRILSVGATLIREIDKDTPFGKQVLSFLREEDVRRRARRKHKDSSFLVYERQLLEKEAEQVVPPNGP
jgi:5-methylcytosine-specific restriction endonuclease McrA